MDNYDVLRLQSAQGIGVAAQRSILGYVARQGLTLPMFFALSAEEQQQAGLSAQQVAALNSEAAISTAQRWALEFMHNKIEILHIHDAYYPSRLKSVLGKLAPPILAMWGNLELLERPAVGWCGSRHASLQGIEFTESTVKQATEREIVVVSGAARGIDATAHATALTHGGATIIVAPEGVSSFRLRTEIRQLVTDTNTLIISEFQPNARWSAVNAMTRNHTLIGLSNAMIVVESGTQGGTYEAGNFALKMRIPLFVAAYAFPSDSAPGNAYFLQRGATPIQFSQPEQKVGLHYLFDEIGVHYVQVKSPPSAVMQGTLFDRDQAHS